MPPADPIRLARRLIDIPSISGDEGAIAGHLHVLMERAGFVVERQEIASGRWNLLARAGGAPRVVLCSHIDTVPPYFPSREDDSAVYGRGACDAKGIIAAMLTAGLALRAAGVLDFAFLFVVGEETDSIGAKKANEAFAGIGSEFIVVGEPTGSKFVRASKGAFTVTVSFRGIAAHSAYPERGDSAVLKMMRGLDEVVRTPWGEDPVLGRGTVNIGVVRGGERPNVVPVAAEAQMIFRIVEDPSAVAERLRSIVTRHDGEIVRTHGNPPTFMAVPEGVEPIVVAFNTDVPHLTRFGRPLLFGPGSILDAHGAHEKIEKSEIMAAVETYRSLVLSLLSGKVQPS
jgi:acetylornithine deacetylase